MILATIDGSSLITMNIKFVTGNSVTELRVSAYGLSDPTISES